MTGGLLIAGAAPASARPMWSVVPTPSPVGSLRSTLSGVACPHPNSCFAVREYLSGAMKERSLIEHWNGRSWRIVTTNPDTSRTADLYGVACPSLQSCFAAGSYLTADGTRSLIEHWNGHHWGTMATPNPASSSVAMAGVACPSTGSCFAVGNSRASTSTKTLIEHWNGRTWTIMKSPDPTGATSAELSAVACGRLRSCAAVGDRSTTRISGLAEHYA